MAYVYLLHFDKPYWTKCQHYIGYTTLTVEERIAKHHSGRGSKLVAYALRDGTNDFEVVRTWEYPTKWEARQAELRFKKNGHLAKLCPVCGDKNNCSA